MKLPACLTLHCRHAAFTFALAALLANQSAQAANKTWTGTTNANLATGTNWGGTAPVTGDALIFTSATGLGGLTLNNDLASGFSVNGITFNAGASAFIITGANSIASTNAITNNSANTQTINTGVILTGGNINVSTVAGGTTVLGGVVSQDGTIRRLSATGLGTLIVNGTAASTYTGQTSASGQGTFVVDLSNISGHSNLINTASNMNLGNGNGAEAGTLVIKGAATGTSSQTLAGFTLAAGTAGSIVVNSNGGSGTNLNLGTGITRTTNGGAGGVVTFDISSAGSTLTGTTLGLTAAAQTAAQGVRGYALVKDATGTGFAANVGTALVRYTGATALTSGGSALATTAANNYNLAAGGTTTTLATTQTVNSLEINSTGSANILDIGAGVLTVTTNGIIASGSAALTIQNGQLGATNSEVIVHALGTGGVTIGSNISGGTGALTKAGSDTLTVTGNNTYSGNTYVVAGILKAGSATAFSVNSLYVLSQAAGAGLDLNGFDVSIGALNAGGSANAGIVLGAKTLTVGAKNTAFDSNSIISGTGGGLTKVGTGIMQAFASSTYTGATTITGGTIRLRNQVANTLGINSALTIGSAGTLDLFATSVSVGSLTGSGAVTNTSISNVALTTGGDNASTAFSGVISNGTTPATMITGFAKTGTGTQTLSGANSYTGVTTLTGGTLSVDSIGNGGVASGNLGSATNIAANLVFNGGTLQYTGATASTDRNFTINAGKTATFDVSTNNLTISGATTATTGALTKIGAGTLTLTGANLHTGATTLTGGTLSVATIGNGGVAGNLGQASNAATNLVFNSGTLQYTGATAGTDRNFTINNGTAGTFDVSTNNLTVSGSSTATTGALTKIGAGTLTLTGVNLHTGLTMVNAGTLAEGVSNALATGDLTVNGATAIFDLGASHADSVGTVTLGGGGGITGSGTSALTSTGTFEVKSGSASAILAGNVALNKTTGGTATLTGANTYSGATNVSAGTLNVNNTLASTTYGLSGGSLVVNANNRLPTSAAITLTGGTLALGAYNNTVASVSLQSGSITGSGTLTSTSSYDVRSGSASAVLGGSTGLAKSTGGTVTLTGANTYSGATVITGGTLALGASGSISNTSGVNLGTGGNTFDVTAKGTGGYTVGTLTGSGTVVGALTVSTELAIGNSPGTANFDDLTLGAASTYSYQVSGGGITADLGNVAGYFTISSGAILNLIQLGTYTANDKFTLFAYPTGHLSGTFSGLGDDTTFTALDGNWKIDYNDTTAGLNGGTAVGASYVTVTAIPESGSALLGSLGLLVLLRRRRLS